MNKKQENSTTKVEQAETLKMREVVIEDSEKMKEQMLADSKKEVANFEKTFADALAEDEKCAAKEGLEIDAADKGELQDLYGEAKNAKEGLKTVLTPPPPPQMPPPLSQTPPPLPEWYVKQNHMSPPPPPQTPPPLPENYRIILPPPPQVQPPLPEDYLRTMSLNSESKVETIEDESKLIEYLGKSKIKDPDEALKSIMNFAGVDSKAALLAKLNEKDEEGDPIINMDLFTPTLLNDFFDPSIELIKKVKNVGDALGYGYINTPGYRNDVDKLVHKLNLSGRREDALAVEDIFKDLEEQFENEKNNSLFEKIDEKLVSLFQHEEKFREFINNQKNLPPDAVVYLYHGLGAGGYDGALDILNSKSRGVEQRGGNPTLSITPSGGFWMGVGFRYALKRNQIEFPGENNPNAVVRMWRRDNGLEDAGVIINEEECLPLDKFDAKVMRSKHVLPNPEVEKKLIKKLQELSIQREMNKDENKK